MDRLFIVLAVTSLLVGVSVGVPSCVNVLQDVLPCLPYINRTESQPSSSCCSGVQQLRPYARSKGDRVAICQCLMSYAPEVGIVDYSRILGLPRDCGVTITLPTITKNLNCSRV